MRPGARPSKLLVLLIFLFINFTTGGKLGFYQDVEPEPSEEDITYKQIARYLESHNYGPRAIHRPRMAPHLPWTYDEYLDYRRQKEKKILEALLKNPSILEVLENQKIKNREEVQPWSPQFDTRVDFSRSNNNERSSFMGVDPVSNRFDEFSNIKIPYAKTMLTKEKPYYDQTADYSTGLSRLGNDNYPFEDSNADGMLKIQGKLEEMSEQGTNVDPDKSLLISEQEPEFTFKFNEPKINEHDTFAIRPNDRRYYEDETRTTFAVNDRDTSTPTRTKVLDSFQEQTDMESVDDKSKSDTVYIPENIRNNKFAIMKVVMPEPHRRAEHNPLIVSSNRSVNNDIYFIAIVAGCSAAAMFVLVLISLTWCRLQRGVKAAADIEYPAYGVTGPNKDISPSGDQRLAHSAQMYHFQHQKQQIIAMENRTAGSRDPGSVSDAESDEENEEGDYTVYECPGLASTGEMEVKNPLFHDDPTPATPPQNHKDEDHN